MLTSCWTCRLQTFSPILQAIFSCFEWFPLLCKTFKFNQVPFLYFCFYFFGLRRHPKHIDTICQKSGLPMFCSTSFMVLDLSFRSLIDFEFIFVDGVRKWSSGCSVWYCPAFLTPLNCWRDCFFSTVQSCLLCCRLIDHKFMGLFLDYDFCVFGMVVMITIVMLHNLKSGRVIPPALFLFLNNFFLALWGIWSSI